MKSKKVDVKDLQMGMYVEELDRPWEDTPFLFQGFLLRTLEDIQEVQEHCKYVYITVDDGSSSADPQQAYGPRPGARADSSGPSSSTTPLFFYEEIKAAREVRVRAKELVVNMHDDIRKRRKIDVEGSKQVVDTITQSSVRNPNALLWLTHLKNRDEYTALHSMNVCVLSVLFGHHLGLEEQQLQDLGLGALLHDMGKLRVPLEVLNKPGRLTEQEFAIMKQHPVYGVELLQGTKGVSAEALAVVYSHHERVNGKGYPRGLKADEISEFSKIVSIVDVYDAVTSDRVYRAGKPPPEVIMFMYQLSGQDFDSHLMEKFVECLGVFPIGSIVELATGEVGVVISHNKGAPLKPKVMLILDKYKKKYYPLRMLNLKLLGQTSSTFSIKQGLPSGAYGINVSDYVKEVTAA